VGFQTKIASNSFEDTFAAGKRIAALLKPGSVIALCGALGSGKTCFVKGIAKGLGIDETITSPTYTIINEYNYQPEKNEKEAVFYHIDAYRLENDKDFEDIGGLDILNSNGISAIEWSGRISKSLPPDVITITIEITGADSRLIEVTGLEL